MNRAQGICFLSFHRWLHLHRSKHLKETLSWGTFSLAKMGKQNIQAKKTYFWIF